MEPDRNDPILAIVAPSPIRRIMAVALLAALGGLLIYGAIGAEASLSLLWRGILLGAAVLALWAGMQMLRAGDRQIELRAQDLRDSSGILLTTLADIEGVDRGALAFKPSNGFALRLRRPAERAWMPGLWWRWGRRIGIGGITPPSQTKFMSETIQQLIAARD